MVEFCKSYLVMNREAFSDPRLELVINDARFGLYNSTMLQYYNYN